MPRAKPFTARQIFTGQAARFASLLRKLLPIASQQGPAAEQARRILHREADRTSRIMAGAGHDWALAKIPAAFKAGVGRAARDLRGIAPLQFGQVNTRLAIRLAQDVARDLAVAGSSPERFYDMALARGQAVMRKQEGGLVRIDRNLTKILAQGVLEREAPAALSRRLMAELGLEKGDRVLLLNGQKWDATAYMNLVARTRTAEAANLGYAEESRSKGFEFVKMSKHSGVDKKDICYVLQGQVFALGPNDQGIPLLPPEWGLPPWHPNCLHTFGVWVPEFQESADIRKAENAGPKIAARVAALSAE